MKKTWNITVDSSDYQLVLEDKNLSINGGEFVPLTKFKKKTHLLEREYFIPLGNETVVLHISSKQEVEPVLTIHDKDCVSGEMHEVEKIPVWAWFVVALYIFNFLFIMGGALGGAVTGGCGYLSLFIAADRKKSIVSRVLTCVIIYVVVTIFSIIVASAVRAMLR